MNHVIHDLRFGLRSLVRNRSFALIAILTLGVALGANTAIFSFINAILLQPLPFPNADRIVTIGGYNALKYTVADAAEMSWPNIADVRAQSKTLEHVAAFQGATSFLYLAGEPQMLHGAAINADAFAILGVRPELGHAFDLKDDQINAPPVILLSDAVWRRSFAADRGIVGKEILFGTAGKTRTVIGILPPALKFPVDGGNTDFWIPLNTTLSANGIQQRGQEFLEVIGLERPGVILAAVNADVDTIARRLEKQYPNSDTGFRIAVASLQERLTRAVRPPLLILFIAVLLVLLIGCANVANLLLARATARHREIAIRSAIGATRTRIAMQLLTESMILSLLSGCVGLLVAAWGIDLLVAIAPPTLPRIEAIGLDTPVLLFTLLLSLATGIIFGLVPAIAASRTNLAETLNDASRGSTEGRTRGRLRNALVIGEIALSLVLLVGAGLLIRSFVQLINVSSGFDYHDVAVAQLSARSSVYKDDPQIVELFRRFGRELATMPGVESVSGASALPLGPSESVYTFDVSGQPPFAPGHHPIAITVNILPGYFHTMRMPLLRGRDFSEQDGPSGEKTIVIDETLAQRFFAGQNPIGHKIDLAIDHQGDGILHLRTIIGVVGAVRFESLSDKPMMTVYLPEGQLPATRMFMVIRTANAASIVPAVRMVLRRIDPLQPLLSISTVEQMRTDSLAGRRVTLITLTILAVLALVLAAVGIYSIMSYSVAQRTPEIGIRMALGAQAGDVFRLILRQSLRMTAIGVGAGVIAAAASTRVMRSLLFGVGPGDPATLIAICVALGAVALVASYIPARRAARVDPLVAIRYD
jgi:putative ABC transport system permease protein